MGLERITSILKYGDEWRLSRRIFHQELNSTISPRFQDTQLYHLNNLLALIRDDPDSFENHYKYFSSGIILEIIYGFKIKPIGDPYVTAAEKAMNGASQGLLPGAYLVDAFPILKSIPEWFPGAAFKRNARKWGEDLRVCLRDPFAKISQSFESGTAAPSLVTSWLSRIKSKLMDADYKRYHLEVLENTAGTAFLGGYESTSATLLNFTLHMVQNPEIQHKAHDELDRIIGRERVPGFMDKESLPYINAIYKECLRCHPIAPFGMPHAAIADDQYKGMHIPKGCVLLPNLWAMSRNEKDYGPDAHAFRPDRFLYSNARDPASYVFGFGRRICPGRYMAEDSLFIAICGILQIFSITRALNEDGSEKPLEPRWVNSMVMHPTPFPASLKPRFDGAECLIQTNE